MRRPIWTWVLILFIVYGVYQAILMFSRESSVDAQLLDIYNLGFFLYIYSTVFIVLALGVVYALWERKQWGYKVAQWFFGINIVYMVLTLAIGLLNKNVLVGAAIKSRSERGLSTEGAEAVLNPVVLMASSLIFIAIYFFAWWYIRKNKGYFLQNAENH